MLVINSVGRDDRFLFGLAFSGLRLGAGTKLNGKKKGDDRLGQLAFVKVSNPDAGTKLLYEESRSLIEERRS